MRENIITVFMIFGLLMINTVANANSFSLSDASGSHYDSWDYSYDDGWDYDNGRNWDRWNNNYDRRPGYGHDYRRSVTCRVVLSGRGHRRDYYDRYDRYGRHDDYGRLTRRVFTGRSYGRNFSLARRRACQKALRECENYKYHGRFSRGGSCLVRGIR